MITNSELNSMGLATVNDTRAAQLPAALPIKGRTGKQLGTVQYFTGSMSANALKEQLKAQNPKLSGKELAKKVNEVLKGEVDLRQQLGQAWLTAAFQAGWTCDAGILRKNRGGLNLVRVERDPVAVEKSPEEKRNEALAVLGLSEADFAMLKALTAGQGN